MEGRRHEHVLQTLAAGSDGVACRDLKQNGTADPEEDLNGEGVIDTLDCRAALPGTATAVSGKVSTPAGALDRFAAVGFEPTGGGARVEADVASDGSYTAELDDGDYASRPGYEDVMVDPFAVTIGGANALDFVLPEVPDGEYISSEDCGCCHTIEYASFNQTGHPFKLNQVVNGEQPIYPFTTLNGVLRRILDDNAGGLADPAPGTDNPLGTPVSRDDVS